MYLRDCSWLQAGTAEKGGADGGGGGGGDGDGAGLSAKDAGAYEKLQLDYRSLTEERENLKSELEEARGELSTTQGEQVKRGDEFDSFMARREGELAITKRMAHEVVRLREEGQRKDGLALEAVKIIKTMQVALAAKEGDASPGKESAAAAEAKAVLAHEEEERERNAKDAATAAADEIAELEAENARLTEALSKKADQMEQKDAALKKAVASAQK